MDKGCPKNRIHLKAATPPYVKLWGLWNGVRTWFVENWETWDFFSLTDFSTKNDS